jgi:hypothetical protein
VVAIVAIMAIFLLEVLAEIMEQVLAAAVG